MASGKGILLIFILAGVAVVIGAFSLGLFDTSTEPDPLIGERVLINSVDFRNIPCRYAGVFGVIESVTSFPLAQLTPPARFVNVAFDTPQDGVNSATYDFDGGCIRLV